MVHSKDIGKFDLEYIISKAIFVSDKLYLITTQDGKEKKVGKGVQAEKLSYEDYLKMYRGESINYATKKTTKRNYALGTVSITNENNIKLKTDVYRKRRKKCIVKDNKFVWIGTSPIRKNNL